MLKMMQYKLFIMPLWRKLLSFVVIFLFVSIDVKLYKGLKPTLLEFVVIHFNDAKTIDYFYLILIMILSADIFNGAENPYEDIIVLKTGGRKKWFFKISVYTLWLSFAIACVYMLAVCMIGTLGGFTGFYIDTQFIELKQLHSWQIVGEIILLTGLRISFLNMLILCINLVCMNNPMGFVAVFVISIIDRFFYETFDIMEPLRITPIEHTRIIYTEAVAPMTYNAMRFPVSFSVLYWIAGIFITINVLYLVVMQKDFGVRNIKY